MLGATGGGHGILRDGAKAWGFLRRSTQLQGYEDTWLSLERAPDQTADVDSTNRALASA